jgi:hypothetical protein
VEQINWIPAIATLAVRNSSGIGMQRKGGWADRMFETDNYSDLRAAPANARNHPHFTIRWNPVFQIFTAKKPL